MCVVGDERDGRGGGGRRWVGEEEGVWRDGAGKCAKRCGLCVSAGMVMCGRSSGEDGKGEGSGGWGDGERGGGKWRMGMESPGTTKLAHSAPPPPAPARVGDCAAAPTLKEGGWGCEREGVLFRGHIPAPTFLIWRGRTCRVSVFNGNAHTRRNRTHHTPPLFDHWAYDVLPWCGCRTSDPQKGGGGVVNASLHAHSKIRCGQRAQRGHRGHRSPPCLAAI